MSMKLKALGLALVAAMAVGAFGAGNASASTGGHFTTGNAHTLLTGTQFAEYSGTFAHGDNLIECKIAEVNGTTDSATVTEVTLTPKIETCRLRTVPSVVVNVTLNGCDFTATIGKKATAHNTVHLGNCNEGTPGIVLHWTLPFFLGTCTVTIKPQTAAGGVAYHTGGSGKTHDLLADITTSQTHSVYTNTGVGCNGTSGTVVGGDLEAEATVRGFDTDGNQVGITATGSED